MLTVAELSRELLALGVRRVHVLAWRDLDDPDAGGSEVHAHEFMRRWAAAGLEVTHRTSAAAGQPTTAWRDGYRVVRRGGRHTVFPRVVAAEVTRRMGPYDALVEVWNGVPWFSPVWCRTPKVTFVHHVHGPMWDQILPGPLAGLGRHLESTFAPPFYRRTTTLTPSDASRDELLALGFHPERVVALHNGVHERFRPGGTRSPVPLVLGVGRMAPVKRFGALLDAVAVARGRVPGLQVVLAGDGPERAALEEQVRSIGAAEWVRLPGRVDDDALVDLYRQAWLVASASLAEGWGMVLTEAAACGTPCVATDISGHRSSVVDGVTGVLAPLPDLGDRIADVLLDDRRRAAMGEAALARARTLTWDGPAEGILGALLAAAHRHASR